MSRFAISAVSLLLAPELSTRTDNNIFVFALPDRPQ
jgi:hypothetical protein